MIIFPRRTSVSAIGQVNWWGWWWSRRCGFISRSKPSKFHVSFELSSNGYCCFLSHGVCSLQIDANYNCQMAIGIWLLLLIDVLFALCWLALTLRQESCTSYRFISYRWRSQCNTDIDLLQSLTVIARCSFKPTVNGWLAESLESRQNCSHIAK